jgi:hypothetical protein
MHQKLQESNNQKYADMIKFISGFTLMILLTGCEKDPVNLDKNIRVDKELIEELNAKSFDTLVIESNRFVLDAYLWRDFMPFSPENGKPMVAINWLRQVDSTEIPDHIHLMKQYVIFNDSIWTSAYATETHPNQSNYKIERVSREGPKWGPKIYVDVISNVYDAATNKNYFIRTKKVYVERTD